MKSQNNHAVRMVYNGLGYIVDIMDWLGYDYMVPWRNDMMAWRCNLEMRYKWLKEQN